MIRRIMFTISYDGKEFCGWQKQSDSNIRTAQGVFEKGCAELFKQEIECIGASRTDKGVHAFGQRATIDIESSIPVGKMCTALNCFLPDEMAAVYAEEVDFDFHCRYLAKSKTYEYKIYNDRIRNPVLRNYSEFVRQELDIISMQKACEAFIGCHDFKSFCAKGSSVKTTTRTIFELNVFKNENLVIIRVRGDGFLYNMIRIIAGTLIFVGLGKIKPDAIEAIILSLERQKAGKTAGAGGLTLINIEY